MSMENRVILRPAGRLLGSRATDFKAEVRELLRRSDVAVDMSGISFADSEGLSCLVALYKSAAEAGRGFSLFAVRYNVLALIRLTRLHRVFTIHENEEAALATCAEAGDG